MGTYRVTRKIQAGPLFESYVGAHKQQAGEVPVWLRRVVPPWSQDASFFERFAPLAEHWRALPSDVVSALIEFGTGADSTWVTQSLADGESIRVVLSALTAKQQRPQMNEVVALGIRVAGALATIHEQSLGLHHGDVCASTVQLTATGEVLLTDFGIASAAGSTPQNGLARTEPGTLAPEQHQTSRGGPAADVYRLGLVLLELVTGRAVPAASWPGVPEKLATALSWMLAKDPAQRPQARDVESALQLAAEQSNWSVTQPDLVRFLARLLPDRAPRTSLPPSGGTELSLKAMVPASLGPTATPPGVALGRISTKKVTPEVFAAEKERLAAEAAAKVPAVPPWRDSKVADTLVAKGLLTAEQVEEAAAHAESVEGSLNDAIISMALCDEDAVIAVEAELTKTHAITAKRLVETRPVPEVLGRLKAKDAEALNAVPLGLKAGEQLVVAVRDPLHAETLEAVKRLTKANSILAVRAGPAALARALAAYYQGVDTEDPSSWLENGADTFERGQQQPEAFVERANEGGIELEDTTDSSMELEARGTIANPTKSKATLDDPQASLLEATLVLLGDKGRRVQQLVALAGGIAKRLGASEADVGRVRFAAAAIGVVNLSAGKAPWEPVRAEAVAPVAGSGWRSIQELMTRALETSRGPASDLAMLALQTALTFAASAASAKPSGPAVATAVQALKAKQFPKAALEAAGRQATEG